MSDDNDDFELVHGSGNVFRDFGYADADIRQAKCILAAEIIKILDARQWSIRRAEEETGVNHADFARIRNVNLGRFTLDRLMAIIGKLGQEVELAVSVEPASRRAFIRHRRDDGAHAKATADEQGRRGKTAHRRGFPAFQADPGGGPRHDRGRRTSSGGEAVRP